MPNLTPIQQLDAVLTLFQKANGLHFKSIQNKISIGDIELREIMQKLCDDKYIRHKEIENSPGSNLGKYYSLTFEGRLFEKGGGYIYQKRKETISIILQFLSTLLIAVGTILAGMYGVFEFLKYYGYIHHP